MLRYGVVTVSLLAATAAHAGDKPLYQPAPGWVLAAPAPTGAADGDAASMVTFDNQQRIAADGTLWGYVERATRILSVAQLSQAGTVSIEWQPQHGDLIVHAVDIVRGGQRIDALKAGPQFTVIRREKGLEAQMLDGTLTATLAVEGLQVGDVLDVRHTVTRRDPALAGNAVAIGPILSQPLKLGFGRTRLMWPQGTPVQWKVYPVGATPRESDAAGWHVLEFTLPLARQPEAAAMAPGRFQRPPIVEATTFADWAAVSKVMAPLYKTEGLIAPGSALATEVAKIAKAESDPVRRTALALKLVQGQVRYLAKGMDNGNLVPQTPTQTWSTRYGDCKAKTLLLLAILHGLGIEAEGALANLGNGDVVTARLPSIAAFNHIIVIAKPGGRTLWLDGTATDAQLDDIDDVLITGWALPVRAEGATLVEAPRRVPGRPTTLGTVELDMRGGLDLPAPFEATVTIRGRNASMLKTAMAQMGKDEQRRMLQSSAPSGADVILASHKVTFDDAASTAKIVLRGSITPRWSYADARYRYGLAPIGVGTLPDRSRAIWKEIPILMGAPANSVNTTRILLPDGGKGIVLDGAPATEIDLPGGRHVSRTAMLAGEVLTVELRNTQTGGEIAPAEIPAARARLAEARNRLLRIATVPGRPGPWNAVAAAKRAGRYDRQLADYASYIADKPEDASRLVARARFLEGIFEREKAVDDLDKAIALQADGATYMRRASLFEELGRRDAAEADLVAAYDLDPADTVALRRLAIARAQRGDKDGALALVDARIDASAGGEDEPGLLAMRASVLAAAGDASAAIAASDSAIEKRPGNANFLNGRCWIKGTLNVELDSALKDCTRAVEMGGTGVAAALDSRAMVYFRMNRLAEAATDIKAALELRPGASATLFLNGVVQRRMGSAAAGDAALAEARLLNPQVDAEYARFGVEP
ncbi:DUF3857 domain-containing protein [Sphingomonas hengshuiensis]|uniref:DUF3857 domain-containing protein n=1 Tax=Sphingomonas hengshuiensis TaxID=1609977 RepID=A0A7U4LE77_9SPHN|nr:DUF3857 domain-containing protein [Sphingomonas hengshuiensis]AJP71060.1 hypothetical protein TS85_03325 [Sphingomonas hengshuiensis]